MLLVSAAYTEANMGISQPIRHQILGPRMPRLSNADRRLHDHMLRALNKIKKPSTAEEIAELLNRDLEPGDRPFESREMAGWLRSAGGEVLTLYWLEARPRR